MGALIVALASTLVARWRGVARSSGSVTDLRSKAPSRADITQTQVAQTQATPTPTSPWRRNPTQARPERLEDFLKSQDPQANWMIHRNEQGQVHGIVGGRMGLNGSLPQFLSFISPYLIGQSPEFRETESAAVDGPLGTTRTFRQHAAGYEVYGAFARVSVSHGDQAVSEVSADLRPIENVDTKINIERSEAEDRLRNRYQKNEIVELNVTPQPFVYGASPTANELVWQFRVVLNKPRRTHREVLISARDGQILKDLSVNRR